MITKKEIYDQTEDRETCGNISLEMVGVNFGPECRYLIGMDSNVKKKSF